MAAPGKRAMSLWRARRFPVNSRFRDIVPGSGATNTRFTGPAISSQAFDFAKFLDERRTQNEKFPRISRRNPEMRASARPRLTPAVEPGVAMDADIDQ